MEECPGGSIIVVRFGYWREHNMTDNIYYCRNYFENCLGGVQNYTCLVGSTGALCESCDIYGKIDGN